MNYNSVLLLCRIFSKGAFASSRASEFAMAYADSGRFFKLRINGLLDEEAFAKLIASDEHFGRAIAGEQVGNFPVLKNPLRLEGTGCGNQFQMLAVHDTVTMEEDRLPRVKHGENNSAVAHERRNPSGEFGHKIGIEIIQNIPHQHGIKGLIGIQHGGLEKSLRPRLRQHLGPVRPCRNLLLPLRFFIQEILPGGQQILGIDLEASLDKESDGGLPGRPQIQQMTVANSIELPEKFLEAVGLPPGISLNARSRGGWPGVGNGHFCNGVHIPRRRMPLWHRRNLARPRFTEKIHLRSRFLRLPSLPQLAPLLLYHRKTWPRHDCSERRPRAQFPPCCGSGRLLRWQSARLRYRHGLPRWTRFPRARGPATRPALFRGR